MKIFTVILIILFSVISCSEESSGPSADAVQIDSFWPAISYPLGYLEIYGKNFDSVATNNLVKVGEEQIIVDSVRIGDEHDSLFCSLDRNVMTRHISVTTPNGNTTSNKKLEITFESGVSFTDPKEATKGEEITVYLAGWRFDESLPYWEGLVVLIGELEVTEFELKYDKVTRLIFTVPNDAQTDYITLKASFYDEDEDELIITYKYVSTKILTIN